MGAPAIKYTDRDVRENPDFVELAERYLESYEGEFQYLIDCKMRVQMGISLTTGMIRGVLNCMRVDPRAPEMPAPKQFPQDEESNVVSIERPRRLGVRKKSIYADRETCPLYNAGIFHRHKKFTGEYLNQYLSCRGLYRINRAGIVTMKAKVKWPYMVAMSGSIIHKVGNEAYTKWHVPQHEYGWYFLQPDLVVRSQCQGTTLVLKNPRLLEKPEAKDTRPRTTGNPLPLCSRCFPEGKVNAWD